MQRGDIFELRMPKAVSHEQAGCRFGVVVQSDVLRLGSVVLVAPTSVSARPASIRPVIEIEGMSTKVLVEHVGAVDVTRLGSLVGRVSTEAMWAVDDRLCAVLALR